MEKILELLQKEYDEAGAKCVDECDDAIGEEVYDRAFNDGFRDGFRDGIAHVIYLLKEGKNN